MRSFCYILLLGLFSFSCAHALELPIGSDNGTLDIPVEIPPIDIPIETPPDNTQDNSTEIQAPQNTTISVPDIAPSDDSSTESGSHGHYIQGPVFGTSEDAPEATKDHKEAPPIPDLSALTKATEALVNNQTLPGNESESNPLAAASFANATSGSVLLDVSIPSMIKGSYIMDALAIPHNITKSAVDVDAIPTLITKIESGQGQLIIATIGKIIPGQAILISIDDSIIPEFGGLKEISMHLSPDAAPFGDPPPNEWFTAEVDKTVPKSLTDEGLGGSKPVLFINIQYPFEQTGTGYNWGDPKTYAQPPTMTIVTSRNVFDVQTDPSGCPVVDAYTLTPDGWTGNGLGEISSRPTGDEKCEIVVQTHHFSKFAFSLRHINSIHKAGPGLFGLGIVASGTSADFLVQDKADIASKQPVEPAEHIAMAEPSEGFDDISCVKGYSHALMIGNYTGGDEPLGLVILRMTLLDSAGKILESGKGTITDVGAHQTKEFHAIARYNGDFDSCAIHVDSAIPVLRN